MSPRRAFNVEGSEIALVQNRLNVAALALTALVFSGSFTLALFGSLHQGSEADFRCEFLHILCALALGITSSLASIGCFLQSQHAGRGDPTERASEPLQNLEVEPWYSTSQWWFSLGQLLLYMALSQALTSSLTEIDFGVSLSSKVLGAVLGILATLVWWTFLFFGPLTFLRRMRPHQTVAERRALLVAYGLMIVAILAATGAAYQTRGGGGFLRNAVQQLYQPLMWHTSW